MRKLLSLFIVIFCVSIGTHAQPIFPENGPLYVDNVVPRVDILIDPDTLDWLYQEENLQNDIEFHAVFIFDNGTIIDTVDPVGFRLRGNTSRYSQKKSFKVSFNSFTQGGKYYGVEKLNLNGEHNDPSVIRSKVSWDLMRFWDIPAPRSNHVEVYINGDYYGLYISVEHIDEEFVKSRFQYNDGNLYKCLYPADLNYLGSNPDLYKLEAGDRRVYELKTNKQADDYSDIAHFIDVLNNTSDDELYNHLHEVFNVDDYIKVIVIDILTANWDGYIYNKNNFYLYKNTSTGKFEYIPYDMDNTMGIDWSGKEWELRNIYDWQQHGDQYRPLYERLMNSTKFRDQYTYYSRLLTETLDLDSLTTAIKARRDLIFPYITNDPYYPKDYGYTPDDFLTSYENALWGHVVYGLLPFLETRTANTKNQVEDTQMIPVIKYIDHNRQSASELIINAFVEVGSAPAVVEVQYQLENEEPTTTPMYDDGNHNDGEAGDLTYGASIDEIPQESSLSYQIKATDNASKTTTLPFIPVFVPAAGSDDVALFINEFMASNETTIADEYEEYDDWIEIYNAESEPIWLGNKYLTDNLNTANKWQMPDYNIKPGEFLLIWADDDPEQGPFHTNFKLSKDGEEIGIFSGGLTVIDEYVFGPQETDISEGRLPDGGPEWIFFTHATPGLSNEVSAIPEIQPLLLNAYPNPVSSDIIILNHTIDYKILDSYGRIVSSGNNTNEIDISNLEAGFYFIIDQNGNSIKLIRQ